MATGSPGKLQKQQKNEDFFTRRFWKPSGLTRADILGAILGAKIVPKSGPKSMMFLMRFSMHSGNENEAKIVAKINEKLDVIWEPDF